MKEVFKILISEFLNRDLSNVFNRDLHVSLNSSRIISIIGARRTGKTYFLFSLINKLRGKIKKNCIVYVNFEDDRLFPIKLEDMKYLLDAYYELFPENRNSYVYFFLDEIQNIKNWELFVRRIYDTEKCRLFITGSSSKLLSKEIATSLRGRTLTYEVFPLSFKEYLSFNNLEVDLYSPKKTAYIKNSFNKYVSTTAFPELVNFDTAELNNALQGYLDMIIYKDLIERYKIANAALIKNLIKFFYQNISNLISANKIFNDFKSRSMSLSKDTLHSYIDHLEDAYVLFFVPVFTNNLREINRNPKKIYSLDIGLNISMTGKLDIGRIFENIAFLHLRRKYDEIFYSKLQKEVDFIIEDKDSLKTINVSYSLDVKDTRKREIDSLLQAMETYKTKHGLIITNENEEEIKIKGKTISVKPMWKWLLE